MLSKQSQSCRNFNLRPLIWYSNSLFLFSCFLHIRLESEAQKWGDGKSDIIILAKEMCIMMMDMSDFTRYVVRESLCRYVFKTVTHYSAGDRAH